MLIQEEETAVRIAAWLIANRPAGVPASVPILVANRDEIRTRPCIVVATADSKIEQPMRHTSRMRLNIHLLTQSDATPVATHHAVTHALLELLADPASMLADLVADDYILHSLRLQETSVEPDENRGRESVLTYEAVASAL
jgi:hypothetical protein